MENMIDEDVPVFYNTALWYDSSEEKEAFNIDRKKEDAAVVLYQKNGDNDIFERLYGARVPSIKVWAGKWSRKLSENYDDMFGELRFYFVKAVAEYDKKRGSFNTCLYTFFRNCIRNILISRNAKKRRPKSVKSNLTNFVLSLDYGWDKPGDETGYDNDTLHSKIVDNKSKKAMDNMLATETINILSHNNPFVKQVLQKISDGNTLSSIVKDAKTRQGRIYINRQQRKILSSKKHKKMVADIIKNKTKIKDGFSVIDYKLGKKKMRYTIELRKTKEADEILRVIRKLRRNKKELMRKIGS